MSTKTTSAPEVAPPLTIATLKKYAQEVFTPIRRGECVSTIWPLMAGRRIRNKFIISYPELFSEEIGNPSKYLLVYVEPLELTEESNSGFIRLVAKSILEAFSQKNTKAFKIGAELSFDESLGYSTLLDRLAQLVSTVSSFGLATVLFLGEFDELSFANSILHNNLKSVWARAGGSLQFIFLLQDDVTRPESIKKYDEINSLLLRNVVYVPLVGDEDIDYLIDYFAKRLDRSFSKDERTLLREVCGGHPYLLSSCTRLIALMNECQASLEEIREVLLSHFEPRSATQKIFDNLLPSEQEFLKNMVLGNGTAVTNLPPSVSSLLNLGLIKKDEEGKWVPFGEIFAAIIKGDQVEVAHSPDSGSHGLHYDESTGGITVGGVNVEEKFTRQEYDILRFFLKDLTKLRSREEIGEAMWGEQSYDKYSDWAIDQIMSKLRKKLKSLGMEKALVTVRGRGYKFSI